jgi:tRNA G18 (ribose-2'-O)-methylase SpoU
MSYFEIGICNVKTPANLGTLWRSAYQLGAAGIFVIGKRFSRQCSDTVKAYTEIPLREYKDSDHFLSCRPFDCLLVGVEQGGVSLRRYSHPLRAMYLLGAEDNGLPKHVIAECNNLVSLESVNTNSYNVAVAGSIVMYHRKFLS